MRAGWALAAALLAGLWTSDAGAEDVASPPAAPKAPRPADAEEGPSAEDALAAAEKHAAEYLFEEALAAADDALQRGGLARHAYARAWWVRATSLAAQNRPQDAREAFVQALAADPGRTIDPRLGPRIRTPFYQAQSFWKQQPEAPGLSASTVERGGERVLRVTLVDPRGWVSQIEIGQRPSDHARFDVWRGEARGAIEIRAAADSGPLEVFARATDERDNVVFEVGSPERPVGAAARIGAIARPEGPARVAPSPPLTSSALPAPSESSSLFESPVFWIVTGVVVTAAAVSIPVALSQ